MIYPKNSGKEFEQFGLQNTKKCGGKTYSPMRTFGAEVHKSNIIKSWHNKYKKLNYIERHNFCLNDLHLLTKSNRTALQIYRLEEQTFGTPCMPHEKIVQSKPTRKKLNFYEVWQNRFLNFCQLLAIYVLCFSQTREL